MKVVLLAGGLGTRLSEETSIKPKPMVEIGGKPIIWHIMKLFSYHGYNDFIICLGYKGYVIKEYFANYFLHQADVTIDMVKNEYHYHKTEAEPWKVSLIDTGINTMTGGRIRKIKDYIGDADFMLTYGDGVGDVDISKLVEYHQAHDQLLTVTAVQPSGRFGALNIDQSDMVESFIEKPRGDGAWINGGFFVCNPKVIDYIEDDATIWEKYPMEKIAEAGEMKAYKHEGFWKPMDTLRDKNELQQLWDIGDAPWKLWGQ